MPIFTEDIIIRLLVDSKDATKDLKKTDASIKTLGDRTKLAAKNFAAMGAAMGGVSIVIELVVKAVTQYVEKIKEASEEYMTAAREAGEYYSTTIQAVDDLTAAEDRLSEARARSIDEAIEGSRERRAANKNEKAFLLENVDLIEFYTRQLEKQATTQEELDRAYFDAIEKAKEYIGYVSTFEAGDAWQLEADGMEEASKRAAELLKDQERLRELYDKANVSAEAQLLRLRHATEQYGLEGVELLEVQKAQALELVTLNEYYADHREAITLATSALYDMRIETARLNEEQALLDSMVDDLLSSIADLQGATSGAGGMFSDDMLNNTLSTFNQIGIAASQFLSTVFGETKGAAYAQALINTALAVTNALANIPAPGNFIAAALTASAGLYQVTQIDKTYRAALGTPSGGYKVPAGYEGDNYPVMAKSGETVHVERAGETSGQMVNNYLSIDGYQFGKVVTRLIADRKVSLPRGVR